MNCFVTSATVPFGSGRGSRLRSKPSNLVMTSQGPQTIISRRAILSIMVSALAAASLKQPALADRTGKFSTKLTAKRRYLPRIEKGVSAFRDLRSKLTAAKENDGYKATVAQFMASTGADLKPALVLFGTSYFSEGNKIGPVEKELTMDVEMLYKHLSAMEKANSLTEAKAELGLAIKAMNSYLANAKLDDEIKVIE